MANLPPLTPPTPRFLAATDEAHPAAVLIGAPLDLTESFRSGTRAAPRRIRAVSDVLETYSPMLLADLEDLPFGDWGDVSLDGIDIEVALARIADAVDAAASQGALPLLLGGEHTATVGAVRGMLRHYPALQVVQIDAHADLRDAYDGRRLSHATVIHRLADEIGLQRIVQCGIRSGTRDEFELARRCLHSGPDLHLPRQVLDRIHSRPVYLTVDIDVLDPAYGPGTGCPEPGGVTFSELLAFIHSLRGLNVVACDVTEVLPDADVNDVTSVAAAKLVREAALAFARPHRPPSQESPAGP